ncbi:MAG: tetratricopeptide repeat protein, partial [Chthoniobacterales bacterium]
MKIPQGARDLFAGGLVSCHLLTCAITGGTCALLRAATSDAILDEEIHAPALSTLNAEGEKKAQAIIYYMQGILDEESSGPEKAFENYRHVLDLEPGFSELAIYIAHEHLRRGESAEAIGVLKDALKNKPRDMNLCLGLSSIYLRQLHKPDIALQYAQRALDINGEEFAPYEAFWEIYQSENQKGRARQILERAAKSKSTSSSFWLQLGKLAGQSYISENGDLKPEDFPKVSPFFEKALEYANGDLGITNHVADFFTLTKQCERAIPLYQRVLSSDPDFSGTLTLESLALCYARSGKSKEA